MYQGIYFWGGVLVAITSNIGDIRTVEVIIRNPNGPDVSVQSGVDLPQTHSSSEERKADGRLRTAGSDETTTHSSTAQMDVPLTHGVPCWCLWAAAL